MQPGDFAAVFVRLSDLAVAGTIVGTLALMPVGPAWSRQKRVGLAAGTAALLAVWYAVVQSLARQGVFLARPGGAFPWLPVAVFLPIAAGTVLLLRSRTAARLADAISLATLIRIQVLRIIGLVFLVEWAAGGLPAVFALPAGLGDIAVGLLSVPAASEAGRGTRGSTAAILAWNALGLFDFVVALGTGFLSSPGPFQVLSLDAPNRLASAYPLALIPVFGVPLFALLHVLTLRKIARLHAGGLHRTTPAQVAGALPAL